MTSPLPARGLPLLLTLLLSGAVVLPAHALYKVVGSDGKVTYTDRPAITADGKVQTVNSKGGISNDVALPTEVRQAVQRYPVVLYTTDKCPPCDLGRDLLRQRGVPFTERTVTSNEDGEALQRLVGTRELPSLTIGGQILHGLENTEWTAYLDSAGYPRESRLPANFPPSSAKPLVEKKESVPAPSAPARTRSNAAPATDSAPAAPASGGFRF